MTPGDPCPGHGSDCPICEGSSVVPDDLRMALVRHLSDVYATCPPSIDLVDWETERIILLYCAIGWHWHWENDRVETVAREVPFKHDLNDRYTRVGRIDRIIRHQNQLLLGEYKSTSKPVDSGSLYWDRLRLDSQPTLYLIEARRMQLAGELESYNIFASDPLIAGVLYDVWHKPTIRAKKLTQADTKKFFETKEYFGETFDVRAEVVGIVVDGVKTEHILGALPRPTRKNPTPEAPFSIRETPEMFGARLLADIKTQPERYFARRVIPRTDQDLTKADKEFYDMHRLIAFAKMRDLWYCNEHNCDATFRCDFHPICYYDLPVSNGEVPEGFKCIGVK